MNVIRLTLGAVLGLISEKQLKTVHSQRPDCVGYKFKYRHIVGLFLIVTLIGFMGCGSGSSSDDTDDGDSTNDISYENDTPWIGDWVLVNFLSEDDNGEWQDDGTDCIGFIAEVTSNEWIETDECGDGCTTIYTYTVNNGEYTREITGGTCYGLVEGYVETGTLAFSEDMDMMIDYFDLQADDTLVAFKWLRE